MSAYAQGTQLQVGDGQATEAFTTVAEVLDITGPSIERDDIDTTSHDVTDGFRTFIAGLADGGEVSFDIQYTPGNATHNENTRGLTALALNGLVVNWRIVLPVTPTKRWNFAGFVSGFEPGFPVGDKMNGSVTIKITNKPTIT